MGTNNRSISARGYEIDIKKTEGEALLDRTKYTSSAATTEWPAPKAKSSNITTCPDSTKLGTTNLIIERLMKGLFPRVATLAHLPRQLSRADIASLVRSGKFENIFVYLTAETDTLDATIHFFSSERFCRLSFLH